MLLASLVFWATLAATAGATPGVPATLALTLTPSTITADGGVSSSAATVVVKDDTQAGVAGETITLTSTDSGQIPTPITMHDDGSGNYSATIPSSTVAGQSTITATDGALSDTKQLTQTPGPATQIALQLSPTSIPADGSTTTTATATARDANNNPVPGDTVTISSGGTNDTVSSITPHANGTYTATIKSTTSGTSTITATDTSVSSVADSKTLTKTAGPATQIALQLSPTSIPADGTTTSTATATVKDAHDNPVPADTITIGSGGTGDTVSSVTAHGDGTYTATIKSTTSGTSTITATDTSVSSVADSKTLTKTPGLPAQITVQLSPTSIAANGTDTSTATATVKDANNNLITGAAVTFGPAGRFGAVTDHNDGTYTATYTSTTTAGPVTIKATDGAISGQTTLTQNPGPPAHVSVHVSPASIAANGTSTTSVTGTVTDQFGNAVPAVTVSFTPAGRTPSVSTLADGTYTSTYTSTTTAGQVTLAAKAGSASGQTTLNQAAFASTTTLAATPQSAVTNQGVALVAIVTAAGGAAAPSGTVTFQDNGAPIPGCVNQAVVAEQQQLVSQSTCQDSFAAAALPHRLTVAFTSASTNIADSSGATTITVGPSATTTSLAVSSSAVNTGSTATFTAAIATSHAGSITPSGAVAFLDSGQVISPCAAQNVTVIQGQAIASCTVTYQQPGSHSVTARYGGDGNFTGSTSSARTVTVRRPTPRVQGTIRSTMQWTFFFTPSYTAVRVLVVNRAPVGATVHLTCQGKGCPLASRVSIVRNVKACTPKKGHKCRGPQPGVVDLLTALRKGHMKPGTRIVVTITKANWVGKYYRFTIRAARAPSVMIDCLAPGGTAPGVGC